MYCPMCREVALVMADRNGIEIDYCPQCRGVWLDRGELDKIIERAAAPYTPQAGTPAAYGTTPPQPVQPPPGYPPTLTYQQQPYPQHQQPQQPHYGHYKKKKRESFLGELFDFD